MDEERDDKPQAQEASYATADEAGNEEYNRVRYTDIYIHHINRRFHVQSLDDKTYSRITAAPMKSNGQLDRLEAMAQDARLIIACVVRPTDKKPLYNEMVHLRLIRDWDAAITLQLAAGIRQHIGVPEEGELKK